MDQMFDLATWREVVVRSLSELGVSLATFLPSLVGALTLLAVGWLVARLLEVVARRGLSAVGIDRAAARLRLDQGLERAEVGLSVSQLISRLVFWLVFLVFLLSGIEALGLSAVTATLDRLISFIPNVIAAFLIAIGGLGLGRFVATLITSSSAAFGFASAQRLGVAAQVLVAGLAISIALEQLGIDTDLLLVPFTVLLATAGFAMGLSFALGARPLVTHILAGHFLKQSLPRDRVVEIDGRRGFVERVGAIDTLLRDGEQRWSVPNGEILERVVVR